MHTTFTILTIATDLVTNKVVIDFSLSLKEETVTQESFILCEYETGTLLSYEAIASGKRAELTLSSTPKPNQRYLLKIQPTIESIVGDKISSSLQRVLIFEGEVLSTIEIVSPSHQEKIDELFIKWREIPPVDKEEDLIFSYYLEIAKENVFYNVVKKSMVSGKDEITLSDVPDGQYYLRIRVQDGNKIGQWSEVITFIKETPSLLEEQDAPIYIQNLKVTPPTNGETPSRFVFRFNEELDGDSPIFIRIRKREV